VPEVSLITNISFDHTDMLGDTLPAIAFEKAGIIKENVPVVVSERQPEVVVVFEEQAQLHNAPLVFAADHYEASFTQRGLSEMTVAVYKDGKLKYSDLILSSGGIYQLKNLPGILQCVDVLVEKGWKISALHIQQGIARMVALTGLKGRWQILSHQPLVICDTAHNVGGMQLVLQQVMALPYNQLHIVLGVVREKEVNKILEMLPKDAMYYFCQANIPRALEAEQLAAKADEFHLKYQIVPDVNEAMKKAISKANDHDVVFVGGSSFVVAEIEDL
jgi:dihydrofolate synthase / folylpolyglutamate synthase